MSRFDGEFTAAGEASLDMVELMQVLASAASTGRRERGDAIACYLSVSEGWRDAEGTLKGTFASLRGDVRLTGGKE